MNIEKTKLTEQELADLAWAYQCLEHPSFAARLSNVIGVPIERGLQLLPKSWYRRLDEVAELSIRKMLELTIAGMAHIPAGPSNDHWHQFWAMGTGAVGGFLGPLTLLAELPITTALMLRSIADIAHSQGEDLEQEDARLACIQVFALGGRTREDDSADTGYYGLRLTLGLHFSRGVLNVIDTTAASVPLPAGITFVRNIVARFGVVFSDKVAAQLVPVAGGISGAMINVAFMGHFQDIARGHFIVRRLERKYGVSAIQSEYEELGRRESEAAKSYSPLEGW
ncbi:MAG: hypothetical protein H6R26_1319 [Proteobacteria bacterium]|nr:hypothetical protein [Pseudomonadota bacterium]